MPLTRGRQKQRDDIYEAFIALSAAGEALILCFMCSNKAAEFTGNKYSILQCLRTRRINTVHNSLMSGLITAVVTEKSSWGNADTRLILGHHPELEDAVWDDILFYGVPAEV